MVSADAITCPRCGTRLNRTVAPAGIAIMLAVAILYAFLKRYW
jgi:uncharacterized paraquat-inducible protein A